jgi:hypothetical protein
LAAWRARVVLPALWGGGCGVGACMQHESYEDRLFYEWRAKQPPDLLWCNTHERQVYHNCDKACALAGYEGGIAVPCRVVDLTGLCEVVG